MFYRALRLFKIYCMTTALLVVQTPVRAADELLGAAKSQAMGMAKSQAEGAVKKLAGGGFNDSSNDNMLSSVTANAVGAMATELKVYTPVAPDMVFGSAAGSTQMYASMASVTEIEEAHGKTNGLAGIGDLLGSITGNPLTSMALGKIAPGAASAVGNIGFVSSQMQMMNTASTVVEKKITNLNSEVVAYKMAAVMADTLVNGGLDKSKKQTIRGEKEEFKNCQTELQNIYETFGDSTQVKNIAENAYTSIDKVIQAREEIAPSQVGAQKSEMARNNFKAQIEALKASLTAAQATYTAETATNPQAAAKAAKCPVMSASTEMACISLITTLEKNESSGKAPNPANPQKLSMDVSPEQDAAYNQTVARLSPLFDSMMLTPSKRAVLWRLLADLSSLATETHEQKKIEIMSNIFKVQEMLKQAQEMSTTSIMDKMIKYVVNVFFPDAVAAPNVAMTRSERIKNYKPPCIGKQYKGQCIPLMHNLKTMKAFGTLDPSMQQLAVKIVRMGDATNKNPSAVTEAEKANIASVAANKAKITTYLMRSDFIREDRARAEGYASPNYKKLTASFMGLLNSITANVLKSRNMTAQKYLASYGGVAFVNSEAAIARKSDSSSSPMENSREVAGDFDSMEDDNLLNEKEPAAVQKVYKVNDINTDKTVSLFDIISYRYYNSFSSKLNDE